MIPMLSILHSSWSTDACCWRRCLQPAAFGEAFGSVGGLIAGLANSSGQALLDGGARRMRALTGYDRVTLSCGERRAESSRGAFGGPVDPADLPISWPTPGLKASPCFRARTRIRRLTRLCCGRRRKRTGASSAAGASGRCCAFRLPPAGVSCEFCCEAGSPREPSFEFHAAAELFAQMFAMRLAMDEAANR